MGLASRGGTPLQDLALRRIPGAPGQNLDPGLNPGLDPGGVPADTTPGPAPGPAPTGDPEAGRTVGTTGDGTVTAIPPCLLGDVTLGTGQILIQTVVSECLG